MGMLEGRVAIVTGGGNGIGKTISLALAREGAKVAIADIDIQSAKGTSTEVQANGGVGIPVALDVSDPKSVDHLVQTVMGELMQVDILVNNAGIFPASPVDKIDDCDWNRVLDTNLGGCFLCSRAVLPHFIKQKRGRIINVSSSLAFGGVPGGAHYTASKAGIICFTKSLALEVATYGINVNALCPGITDTNQPRANMTYAEMMERAKSTPLGRIGQTEDLIGPVLFLVSDRAAFITGQCLTVNGGIVMI